MDAGPADFEASTITQRKPGIVGRDDNVGGLEQVQSAASAAAHRGDDRHIDAGQAFDRQMIAVDHAAQPVRQLLARGQTSIPRFPRRLSQSEESER